jgi:hypothetical protein
MSVSQGAPLLKRAIMQRHFTTLTAAMQEIIRVELLMILARNTNMG